MLFSSQPFLLLFLPLSLITYYAFSQSYLARVSVLTIASLGFYAWWDPRFVPLLVAMIALNWGIVRFHERANKRWVILLGVGANLAVLGLFKYANFFAESALDLVGVAHQQWSIILPLGISFFTFQQISYLIDRSRGEAPVYGFVEYCAYVSFFPQLIAGPIVRHNEMIPQFAISPWRADLGEQVSRGLVLLTLGLLKKVFFADELAPIADDGFDAVAVGQSISFGSAWLSSVAYSLQLYFDFSAYSDMAIGLGALFGFRLPVNFDAPYRALNIREFWRRWHITLSNFLRDYVYIPLGGNRGTLNRISLIVMLTMLLCGLWHGAGWTFIAWGALYGAAICINRAWLKTRISLPKSLAWTLTIAFVIVGWVLFRAENFGVAAEILSAMIGIDGATLAGASLDDVTIVILGAMFAVLGPTNKVISESPALLKRGYAVAAGCALFLVALRVGQGRGLEFIYFQF